MPVRAGSRVEARAYPLHVEIWNSGHRIARHERCHRRRQHVLDLEHYLDVLSHKPGAFAGSKPLAQWREAGRWPPCYDELWARLLTQHGKQNGTRAMVAVVALGREFGHDALRAAISTAVSLGACDVAAVRYLLTETALHKGMPPAIDVGVLSRYDRPMRKRKLTPTFRLGFDLARLRVVVGEAVCDGWNRELVRGVIRRS